MSVRKPTPEQQAAIDAAGEVLVSASAGSGNDLRDGGKDHLPHPFGEGGSVFRARRHVHEPRGVRDEGTAARRPRRPPQFRKDAAVRARLRGAARRGRHRGHLHRARLLHLRHPPLFLRDGRARATSASSTRRRRTSCAAAPWTPPSTRLLAQKSPLFAGLCAAFADSRGFDNLKDVLLKSYETVIVKPDPRAFLESVPALYGEEGFARVSRELLAPALETAGKLKERCAALSEKTQPFLAGGLFGEGHKKFLGERTALADAVLGADGLFSAVSAAGSRGADRENRTRGRSTSRAMPPPSPSTRSTPRSRRRWTG